MAFYGAESFDNLSALSDLTVRGWTITGMAYSSTAGRRGGGCIRYTTTGVTTGHDAYFNPRPPNSGASISLSSLSMGFGFKFGGSGQPDTGKIYPLVTLLNSAGTEVANLVLQYASSQWCISYRTGVTNRLFGFLARTQFNVNVWHHIELRISSFATTSGSADRTRIYFNGQEVGGDSTGVANSATGTTISFARLNAYGTTTANLTSGQSQEYDDFWMGTVDATRYPAAVGDCRVDTLLPTGDGGNTDFTASAGSRYQCVDEADPHNGVTDYVLSTTLNHKVDFTFPALSHAPSAIHTVKPKHFSALDSGTRSLRTMITSGATEALDNSAYDNALTASYTFGAAMTIGDSDPNTAAQWLKANLTNAKFGVKVTV